MLDLLPINVGFVIGFAMPLLAYWYYRRCWERRVVRWMIRRALRKQGVPDGTWMVAAERDIERYMDALDERKR